MRHCPQFPPAFQGLAAGPANAVAVAVAKARRGVDAGLIVWSTTEERLQAALVLAPEIALGKAVACLPACALGVQNALGALAPPELAVHLEWAGGVRLNGGRAGALRLVGPPCPPGTVPDWLVVGLTLNLLPPGGVEPGLTPDQTALSEEGCGGIDPLDLIEAWSRHTLFWLNELEADPRHTALLRDWNGLAWDMGGAVSLTLRGAALEGTFLGVDEDFGMLLKTAAGTRLIPLTELVEEA